MQKLFYIQKTVESKWKKHELLRRLDVSQLYAGGFYYQSVSGKGCDRKLIPKSEGFLFKNSFAPAVMVAIKDETEGRVVHLDIKPCAKTIWPLYVLESVLIAIGVLLLFAEILGRNGELLVLGTVLIVLPVFQMFLFQAVFKRSAERMMQQLLPIFR